MNLSDWLFSVNSFNVCVVFCVAPLDCNDYSLVTIDLLIGQWLRKCISKQLAYFQTWREVRIIGSERHPPDLYVWSQSPRRNRPLAVCLPPRVARLTRTVRTCEHGRSLLSQLLSQSKSRALLPERAEKSSSKGSGAFLMSFLLYDDPDYTRPMRQNPNLDKESAPLRLLHSRKTMYFRDIFSFWLHTR